MPAGSDYGVSYCVELHAWPFCIRDLACRLNRPTSSNRSFSASFGLEAWIANSTSCDKTEGLFQPELFGYALKT